jgi:hypothetical protein
MTMFDREDLTADIAKPVPNYERYLPFENEVEYIKPNKEGLFLSYLQEQVRADPNKSLIAQHIYHPELNSTDIHAVDYDNYIEFGQTITDKLIKDNTAEDKHLLSLIIDAAREIATVSEEEYPYALEQLRRDVSSICISIPVWAISRHMKELAGVNNSINIPVDAIVAKGEITEDVARELASAVNHGLMSCLIGYALSPEETRPILNYIVNPPQNATELVEAGKAKEQGYGIIISDQLVFQMNNGKKTPNRQGSYHYRYKELDERGLMTDLWVVRLAAYSPIPAKIYNAVYK